MCRLISREVKSKKYYYLEENVKVKGKWKKERYYIGGKKPGNRELLEHFKKFKKELRKKGIEVVVPPLTEFITHVTAVKIEKAKEEKKEFLKKITPKQRKEFIQRERITFITDSNAIEGSTLNFEQTKNILEEEKRIAKLKKKYVLTGDEREQEEALSLSKCLDLYEKNLKEKKDLSEKLILQWHYILLKNIKGYEKYAGIWRPVNVYIRGSLHEFPHHEEVRHLMLELLQWYNENNGLIYPVELAAKFHTKFTSIHPFADGNGRMARLLMNYILQSNSFPFTNIPLSKRNTYMKTQAAGNKKDYKPFTKFLAKEIIAQNNKKKLKK